MKHNIAFIITNLRVGGAEMMLYKLVSRIDRGIFSPLVISLNDDVPMAQDFENLGIPVTTLGINGIASIPRGGIRLLRLLHRHQPQIVQTWMYHADLVGGLGARAIGIQPVIWNIRHSNLDSKIDPGTTVQVAKACARLSSVVPAHIVCCSETAKAIHEKLGYDPKKIVVIPNGFDLSKFIPDSVSRRRIRNDLGVTKDTFLIGLVGRYHPQKGHRTFIRAAAKLTSQVKGIEFLFCGKGADWQNRELVNLIDEAGMRNFFHLLGFRTDVPAITSALDLATSSSICGEGFANTVGEAMACGVPCVVTDVGDSAMIVGDTGMVVHPGDPEELFQAWLSCYQSDIEVKKQLGILARQRIAELFSVEAIADKYQHLYLSSLRPPHLH